ncbi:MAG TPA: sigma-70 family RNA polymerase sigma factor [Gemmataceae bacterium]|nr:sigma-70 family RNA polymerase sigma factor [Gemmataceae bacterium]
MKDVDVNASEGGQPKTSLTLLDQVRKRDKDAWDRLVSLYAPLVYHWCKVAGLQTADVEEVCQEVFLAVARKIVGFHHDQPGDSFRGWLRTITKNKINDRSFPPGGQGTGGSAAHQRLQEMPATAAAEEVNPDAQAVEKNILYRRAVEMIEMSFEPNTRRAFWLLIAGQKANDVAAELQMSAGAVYVAKSKVLKRLREEFHGLLELGS